MGPESPEFRAAPASDVVDCHVASTTAFIDILDGPTRGRRYRLERSRVMIGRDASCALRIPDGLVSRRHLQIVFDRGRRLHFALDIGSANGVSVNDVRLVRGSERALTDGDEIRIGRSRLRYACGCCDAEDVPAYGRPETRPR